MKTNELAGAALQHAVMLAEGWTYFQRTPEQCAVYARNSGPTQTWTVAGPDFLTGPAGDDIIDRELIDTLTVAGGTDGWEAHIYLPNEMVIAFGATRREAAMRAYVAWKLGDEVEIPEELK